MNKLDPDVIAVKVHAGPSHMKRVKGALRLARVLVFHSLIPGYPNGPQMLSGSPVSILWHEVRGCQADGLVHDMQDHRDEQGIISVGEFLIAVKEEI
jgi:hypothetical protein